MIPLAPGHEMIKHFMSLLRGFAVLGCRLRELLYGQMLFILYNTYVSVKGNHKIHVHKNPRV